VSENRRRRVQRLQMSDEFLIRLLSGQPMPRIVENPLPADARILGAKFDPWPGTLEFVIASETYPEVDEGNCPPHMPLPVWRDACNCLAPNTEGGSRLGARSASRCSDFVL
jgi:hypothetical protein